jgi:hypothetical protein
VTKVTVRFERRVENFTATPLTFAYLPYVHVRLQVLENRRRTLSGSIMIRNQSETSDDAREAS